MATGQAMKLERVKQRVEAMDADMSGSTFRDVNLAGAVFDDVNLTAAAINNVNLSQARISDADLRGASIANSLRDGMTIDGVDVADLFAAYRAAQPKTE